MPTIGKYERKHLTLLDPEIHWRVAEIQDWNGGTAPKVKLLDALDSPSQSIVSVASITLVP